MTRRRVLAAGVAVAAASAGLGWALHRQAGTAPARAVAGVDDDGVDPTRPVDVWQLRFDQPGGGELALAGLRGRPVLLNFWATWCPPCVEEMPLLDRFQREHRAAGWQVVGLAVDSAAPVTEFLAKHPVSFAIGLAGMQGVALTRSLGNNSGALPFSVVFNTRGDVAAHKLGALKLSDLEGWANQFKK